ncbi:hypothetical protein HDC90_000583 [Pedobacter sp. AK013]|nr:hypothetical protein [Pedobacter sp. AK013]
MAPHNRSYVPFEPGKLFFKGFGKQGSVGFV